MIRAQLSARRRATLSTTCEQAADRFARRLSSWEAETGDDDLQTEFLDRNRGQAGPSPIDVRNRTNRTSSEHLRSTQPRSTHLQARAASTSVVLAVDEATPGETGFSFTMEAHRELVLADRETCSRSFGTCGAPWTEDPPCLASPGARIRTGAIVRRGRGSGCAGQRPRPTLRTGWRSSFSDNRTCEGCRYVQREVRLSAVERNGSSVITPGGDSAFPTASAYLCGSFPSRPTRSLRAAVVRCRFRPLHVGFTSAVGSALVGRWLCGRG